MAALVLTGKTTSLGSLGTKMGGSVSRIEGGMLNDFEIRPCCRLIGMDWGRAGKFSELLTASEDEEER